MGGRNDPCCPARGLQQEFGEFLAEVRGGIVLAGNGKDIEDGHNFLAEVESRGTLREAVKELRLPRQPECDGLLIYAHGEPRPRARDRSRLQKVLPLAEPRQSVA